MTGMSHSATVVTMVSTRGASRPPLTEGKK